MISIEDYLDILRGVCKNPDAVRRLNACFPTFERMERIRELADEFGIDPRTGREGLVEIYPLSEAKDALNRPDFKVYNWQYDRVSGHLIMNLNKGVHEHLSAALWQCSHPEYTKLFPNIAETEENAEKFIEEGLGWFRSTTSYGRALKGKDVKLNAQEKAVFGDLFMEM